MKFKSWPGNTTQHLRSQNPTYPTAITPERAEQNRKRKQIEALQQIKQEKTKLKEVWDD